MSCEIIDTEKTVYESYVLYTPFFKNYIKFDKNNIVTQSDTQNFNNYDLFAFKTKINSKINEYLKTNVGIMFDTIHSPNKIDYTIDIYLNGERMSINNKQHTAIQKIIDDIDNHKYCVLYDIYFEKKYPKYWIAQMLQYLKMDEYDFYIQNNKIFIDLSREIENFQAIYNDKLTDVYKQLDFMYCQGYMVLNTDKYSNFIETWNLTLLENKLYCCKWNGQGYIFNLNEFLMNQLMGNNYLCLKNYNKDTLTIFDKKSIEYNIYQKLLYVDVSSYQQLFEVFDILNSSKHI